MARSGLSVRAFRRSASLMCLEALVRAVQIARASKTRRENGKVCPFPLSAGRERETFACPPGTGGCRICNPWPLVVGVRRCESFASATENWLGIAGQNDGPGDNNHARSHRRSLARTGGTEERGLRRLEAAEHALRRLHGSAGHSDLPRHRRAPRAGHAAQAVERAWAARAPSSSSTAPRANGAATSSRCRRAGALNPERHMYEEIMVVVEGRGTTEIWTDGQAKPHTFEWQRGSMFSIPLNTNHRIINAASSPALILVASTAPNVMNIFRDTRLDLQLPGHLPVALRRQPRTSSSPRTTSCPIRCAGSRCANRTSFPTS